GPPATREVAGSPSAPGPPALWAAASVMPRPIFLGSTSGTLSTAGGEQSGSASHRSVRTLVPDSHNRRESVESLSDDARSFRRHGFDGGGPMAVSLRTAPFTRRRFLTTAASTVALTAVGGIAKPYLSRAADRPTITHGIQSGDVSIDTAIVWARADRPSRMHVE